MDTMEIGYLADNQQFLPDLALWLHNQWDHMYPGATLETRTNRLKGQLNRLTVPATFVAFAGDTPLGTASIIACDMSTRADLTPWLASVFVRPEARKGGVGRALVMRIIEECRALALPRLYLWTDKEERFYANMGWTLDGYETYKDMRVSMMHYDV